jgi:hypothetical protein
MIHCECCKIVPLISAMEIAFVSKYIERFCFMLMKDQCYVEMLAAIWQLHVVIIDKAIRVKRWFYKDHNKVINRNYHEKRVVKRLREKKKIRNKRIMEVITD